MLNGLFISLANAPPKNLKKSIPAKGRNAYQVDEVNSTANKAVRKNLCMIRFTGVKTPVNRISHHST